MEKMARRIVNQKQEASKFDIELFMKKVEEYFTDEEYGKMLTLRGVEEKMIEKCKAMYESGMNLSRYDIGDEISIPAVYVSPAILRLLDEGFFVFANEKGSDIKVSLSDYDLFGKLCPGIKYTLLHR